MDEKYRNKYRPESLRLKGYDYSSKAIYFLTICTQNRVPYLGKISGKELILSTAGQIVATEWQRTEKIRDRVKLGEWVVMPNHLHGLIYLHPKPTRRDASNATLQKGDGFNQDGFNPSLRQRQEYKNKFGPQKDNVASIIRGFKSSCTRQIRESLIHHFKWQKGYYDNIVRNQKSLKKIEQYIRENPLRWLEDRFYN